MRLCKLAVNQLYSILVSGSHQPCGVAANKQRTYHGYLSLDFDSVRPQIPRYLNSSGPDAIYSDTGKIDE